MLREAQLTSLRDRIIQSHVNPLIRQTLPIVFGYPLLTMEQIPAPPRTYQSRAEMPERFRETLEQMMKSQAYRELAAARMFGHGLQYVEDGKWLKFMVWHIGEETEHYLAVARMYEKFTGESVESWVHQRLQAKPVPFAGSWFELAMAQFLYDRGGFWQLQEYEDCAFPAYREVIGKIIAEERGHQGLGERIVVELCQGGHHEDVKQGLFERWLRLGMLSFGRPGTEGNQYAISAGLKKRDSGAVMQDFLNDIKPAMRAGGLGAAADGAAAMARLEVVRPAWLLAPKSSVPAMVSARSAFKSLPKDPIAPRV